MSTQGVGDGWTPLVPNNGLGGVIKVIEEPCVAHAVALPQRRETLVFPRNHSDRAAGVKEELHHPRRRSEPALRS